jgi:hypothetical protein
MNKYLFVTTIYIFLILATTGYAYAYIDPGTGSFFLQMLLAGLFGSLFFIRTIWGKVKGFVLKILGKSNKDDEGQK